MGESSHTSNPKKTFGEAPLKASEGWFPGGWRFGTAQQRVTEIGSFGSRCSLRFMPYEHPDAVGLRCWCRQAVEVAGLSHCGVGFIV